MPPTKNTSKKLSSQSLALHRKWQEKAEALGGKGVRIVTAKDEAKKIIFNMLKDAFRPMNITDIHNYLKAIVPAPVLKNCLDDMTNKHHSSNLFCNNKSDDEDTDTEDESSISKKPLGRFASSILMKVGRNANTTLYYVDYNKLENNGNGLAAEEKDKLITAVQSSNIEMQKLKDELRRIEEHTKTLLSEPTNKEATAIIEAEEKYIYTMNETIESLRVHTVNESTRKKIIKGIDGSSSQWRKRKRICTDFLILMEESTDGTVSMKKCLSGDGQIYLEGDEFSIKESTTSAKYKRQKYKRSKPNSSLHGNTKNSDNNTRPTETFIGVKLDSSGRVVRVHLNEDDL